MVAASLTGRPYRKRFQSSRVPVYSTRHVLLTRTEGRYVTARRGPVSSQTPPRAVRRGAPPAVAGGGMRGKAPGANRARWRRVVLVVGGLLAVLLIAAWVIYGGGEREGPGVVHPIGWPQEAIAQRAGRQRQAVASLRSSEAPQPTKQILFGDLHVHSTFSADAFVISLPVNSGEGAHPPADACDFARFCSALDFFAMTDHAEALTPRHWQETKDSVRQCNAVAGDPNNPDLVAFVGYEWTQVGRSPDEHYGHKNVIFRDLEESRLPKRPIAAGGLAAAAMRGRAGLSLATLAYIPIKDFSQRKRYLDLMVFSRDAAAVEDCPEGVDSSALPADCRERAATPEVLFGKLDQLGHEAIVIPHGTTWGFYTPHGYTWDKQLTAGMRDPSRQFLIEVFSGHGNSEEYRPWRGMTGSSDLLRGVCPEPTADYEPCCWRAGELVRARCGALPEAECEQRVATARTDYLVAGAGGKYALEGSKPSDWQGCGQCTDCFNPSFAYRPGGSAQYILAKGDFTDPAKPYHERFGFMASSDNHTARPGTGYKEFERRKMTEATGPRSKDWAELILGEDRPLAATSRRLDLSRFYELPPFKLLDIERQSSFFLTGGLVAVHSEGRHRGAIWEGLQRKEVYGTSGDRILLWFDLLNGPDGPRPMGSVVEMAGPPRFTVRAVGASAQQDGCPSFVGQELTGERLQFICKGQCYNPGDTRRAITRIEVVRIRPQVRPDEPVDALIEDPWKRLACPPGSPTCTVSFTDPEVAPGGREVIYYVRAIQEPTLAVNAANLRCDPEGTCDPCFGDYRTPYDDDCLAPNEERAWSSPIFVDFAG